MTESDDSDGERSQSRGDRASRFDDIAAEFTDQFGTRASESAKSRPRDEPPDDGDPPADRASDSDSGTGDWEWVGDDGDEDAAEQNSLEAPVSNVPERSGENGRLWNDSRAESRPTDAEAADSGSTDDDPPVRDEAPDRDPAGDDAERTTTEAGSKRSTDDRRGEGDGRIWDKESPTESPATSTETTASAPGGDPTANFSAAEPTGSIGSEPAGDEPALSDVVEFTPGTNVLIQSESRSEGTRSDCRELLFANEPDHAPYVLLVRYQPMDGERLRRIAAEGYRTHVVSVGYAQSVPPTVDEMVEVTQINNPNDITRLGIVVSRITQGWSGGDRGIRVCYDSLNVLLNYRDVKSAFRFLHVFLSTFTKTDALAHFHADPLEGDPQSINTVKPLFDEVVSIDSTGTYTE